MSSGYAIKRVGAAIIILVLFVVFASSVTAGVAIGPRAGYDFDSEKLILGAEAEFGPVTQSLLFAPSADFELGDNSLTALNADFRLYLFHLPQTGLHFYGAAGPTLLFVSPERGDSETELGLSLVGGVKIPMKGQSRYNVEVRFGIGDIPDLKATVGILFGI